MSRSRRLAPARAPGALSDPGAVRGRRDSRTLDCAHRATDPARRLLVGLPFEIDGPARYNSLPAGGIASQIVIRLGARQPPGTERRRLISDAHDLVNRGIPQFEAPTNTLFDRNNRPAHRLARPRGGWRQRVSCRLVVFARCSLRQRVAGSLRPDGAGRLIRPGGLRRSAAATTEAFAQF